MTRNAQRALKIAGADRMRAMPAVRALKPPVAVADHEVGRTVQREQADDRDAGEHGVAAEQVEKIAGELLRGSQRDAVEEIRERDAPEERRADAAKCVQAEPRCSPSRGSRAARATRRRRPEGSEARESATARCRSRRTWSRTRRGTPRTWRPLQRPTKPRCRPRPDRSTRTSSTSHCRSAAGKAAACRRRSRTPRAGSNHS